jgi:hypothetical protein
MLLMLLIYGIARSENYVPINQATLIKSAPSRFGRTVSFAYLIFDKPPPKNRPDINHDLRFADAQINASYAMCFVPFLCLRCVALHVSLQNICCKLALRMWGMWHRQRMMPRQVARAGQRILCQCQGKWPDRS